MLKRSLALEPKGGTMIVELSFGLCIGSLAVISILIGLSILSDVLFRTGGERDNIPLIYLVRTSGPWTMLRSSLVDSNSPMMSGSLARRSESAMICDNGIRSATAIFCNCS